MTDKTMQALCVEGGQEGASVLLDLAAQCEAASGPNWNLDFEILCQVDHRAAKTGPLPGDPRYTTSLDAAMTLVPKGFDWIIGQTNGGLTIHAEVGGRGDGYMRFAASPALALCAAALRARATPLNEPQTGEAGQ